MDIKLVSSAKEKLVSYVKKHQEHLGQYQERGNNLDDGKKFDLDKLLKGYGKEEGLPKGEDPELERQLREQLEKKENEELEKPSFDFTAEEIETPEYLELKAKLDEVQLKIIKEKSWT